MLARLEAVLAHERRFVADASHELRTPLALLKAELDLALRRRRTRDELEQALHSASEETDRLTRLAEDLLLIARSDAGGLPIRRQPVPAAQVLEVVAEPVLRTRAGTRSGRSRFSRRDGLVLDADPARLEQALGNLVENALAHGARPRSRSPLDRAATSSSSTSSTSGQGFPQEFIASRSTASAARTRRAAVAAAG